MAHDSPEVVRILGLEFEESHGSLVLVAVIADPHVSHKEVGQQLLVSRLLFGGCLVHPAYLFRCWGQEEMMSSAMK